MQSPEKLERELHGMIRRLANTTRRIVAIEDQIRRCKVRDCVGEPCGVIADVPREHPWHGWVGTVVDAGEVVAEVEWDDEENERVHVVPLRLLVER